MAHSDGSHSKIESLRQAATTFVNAIFDDPMIQSRAKISLVPFSAAVAVDPQAYKDAKWVDKSAQSSLHWRNVTGASDAKFKSKFEIFAKLKGVNANWDWAGCFESLPYPLNVQVAAPSDANKDGYFVPMLAPDEAGSGGQWRSPQGQVVANSYLDDNPASCPATAPTDDKSLTAQACKYANPQGAATVNQLGAAVGPNVMCSSRPLTRLTTDRSKLLSEVAALQPAGNTNIHQGLMWGWRTIAPNSVFQDGSSKSDVERSIILMTDGTNTWSANPWNNVLKSLYSSYGYFANADGSNPNVYLPPANAGPASEAQARAAMDALALEGCRAANAAGVTIYTVGFSVPSDPIDQQGQDLLKTCAGSSDRFFMAQDGDALKSAFDAIAKKLTKVRLTN
jgi:von Willebrand factor type A domain